MVAIEQVFSDAELVKSRSRNSALSDGAGSHARNQDDAVPLSVLSGYPRFIYVELTDRCNLACSMCRSESGVGNIMPLAMFQDIASTLFPHVAWVDLRGWGESTTLPDMEKYIDIAAAYPVRLKLITNGTVRRTSLWRRLAAVGCMVGFSIDAADDDLFRRLRGGASLTVVLNTIGQAVAFYAQAGRDVCEYLYFCITVSRANVDSIPDICEMGLRHGIQSFKLEPLWAPDDSPDRLEHAPSAVLRTMATLDDLARRTGARIEYSASLLAETTRADSTAKACIHPWHYCYINARGQIGFCDHLNGRDEFSWGNWGEEPFLDFWNGERMSNLRAQHLARLGGTRIEACCDCNWCYDRRYVDLEHLVQPGWQRYRVFAR